MLVSLPDHFSAANVSTASIRQIVHTTRSPPPCQLRILQTPSLSCLCLRFLLDHSLTGRRKPLRHTPRRPTHSQTNRRLWANPSAQKPTPSATTRHHTLHNLVRLQICVRQPRFRISVLGRPAGDSALGFLWRLREGVEFVALENAGEVTAFFRRERRVRVGNEGFREWRLVQWAGL